MQFDFEAHKPTLLKALKAVGVTPKHIEVLPQDDAMEIVVDNFGLMWIGDTTVHTLSGDVSTVVEFTVGYVAHIDGSYWEPPDEDPVYDQDSTTRSWAEACRLLALIFANFAIEAALEYPE